MKDKIEDFDIVINKRDPAWIGIQMPKGYIGSSLDSGRDKPTYFEHGTKMDYDEGNYMVIGTLKELLDKITRKVHDDI